MRLTPDLQDILIAAGIAQFQVSVHGLQPDIVRQVVPRGARPGLVRTHLERLASRRPSSLRVRLNFVETADNAGQRAGVQDLAARLGFDFFYRREHTRGGSLGDAWHPAGTTACGIFAAVTFISADGEVLPCVNDVQGRGALGNVRDLTWADVVAWKRRVIRHGPWFDACVECDDDYRWVLIGQGRLDEVPPAPR